MYYVKHKDECGWCTALFAQEESAVCFLRYCLKNGETAYITTTLQPLGAFYSTFDSLS